MNGYYANPAVEFDWPDAEGSDPSLVARVHGDPPATVPVEEPAVVETFAYALDGRTREELTAHLAEHGDLDAAAAEDRVAGLVADEVLVPDGETVRQQRTWLRHGWRRSLYYHLRTGDWTPDRWVPGESPADPQRREPGGATDADVPLPEPDALPDRPLDEVLLDRRTCRDFDGAAMTAAELSTLLAAGLRPVRRARETGHVPPGLGFQETASFPFAVRPVVARSPGLDPGTYRYLLDGHALRPVVSAAGDDPAAVDRAVRETVVNQSYAEDGAVTLLVTADLARYRRLRPDPGAFRHLFVAASAHLHRLILAATAMGFGCFQSAALDDSQAAAVAGVDGVDEPVVYLLTVGREAT